MSDRLTPEIVGAPPKPNPGDDDRIRGPVDLDVIAERKAQAEREAAERIQAVIDNAKAEVTPETPWRKRYTIARRAIAAIATEIVPLIDVLMSEASKAVKHKEARKRIVAIAKGLESIFDVIPWAIEPFVWRLLDGQVDDAITRAYDLWKARGKPAALAVAA